MRRLEPEAAKAVATRFAADPLAAPAAVAIDLGMATVIRTKDEKCYVVLPKDSKREVHLVGVRASSDLLDILAKVSTDRRLVMPMALFTQLAEVVDRKWLQVLHVFSSEDGVEPGSVPPPRPDFEVRPVLFSDLDMWHKMPGEALFLSADYGTPKALLSNGMAVGAFNGGSIVSLATASVGRVFALLRVYTHPRFRRAGLASHTVAMAVDQLATRGLRPLLIVPPLPGDPVIRLAERLGLERVAEGAMVPRSKLAL